MRKFSLLLSILVVVSMVLAACGAEETSTSVPSTNVPPITAESTATGDAAATGATATVDPNATGNTTTTPGVPVTGEDSSSRLSNLLDFDVWNQEGEQIGEVEDMVLDMDNTVITYVIVGTGGFLDLGEKEVLVPWESLELHAADSTGGQENAFILQADQETFANAPDVDLDAVLPEMGMPASDWDTDIRGYWESGVVPGTPSADATASPEAGTADATATTQGTDQGQGPLQGVILASEVLGSTIMVGNSQGAGQGNAMGQATTMPGTAVAATPEGTATTGTTGTEGQETVNATIEDVIVDPDTGEILYLVIDASLTEGERWIPVPFGALQWDADNDGFVIKANANALQNAPFFEDGQFPDMSVEGWDDEFETFWQNP